MAREDVSVKIVMPMLATFQPRKAFGSDEQRVALESYFMSLKQFDAATLEEAWNIVVAQHLSRFWPVPGVIVSACTQVLREKRHDQRIAEPAKSFAADRERRWQEAMRSGKAKRALELNVAQAFKFAIEEGKPLHEIDIDALAAARESAERLADRIRADQPLFRDGRAIGVMRGAIKEQALSMYDTMELANAKVAEEIIASHAMQDGGGDDGHASL